MGVLFHLWWILKKKDRKKDNLLYVGWMQWVFRKSQYFSHRKNLLTGAADSFLQIVKDGGSAIFMKAPKRSFVLRLNLDHFWRRFQTDLCGLRRSIAVFACDAHFSPLFHFHYHVCKAPNSKITGGVPAKNLVLPHQEKLLSRHSEMLWMLEKKATRLKMVENFWGRSCHPGLLV